MPRSSSTALALWVLLAACGSSRPPPDHPPSFDLDAAPATPVIVPSDAAPPTDAAPGPTTFTVPAVPVTVTRLTAGKGKAEVLRYALVADTGQTVSLAVDASVDVTAGTAAPQTQAVPTIQSGGLVGVVGVAAGVATMRFRLDTTTTTDDQIGQQLAELHGTQIDSTVDAQGRPGDQIVTSLASDVATATTIASLDQTRIHAIVLPTEPIAVGGTWRVVSHEDINGISTEITTTYRLASRTGTVVKLTGDIKGKAAPQTLDRAQGNIDVKSMTGSGKLTATIDLSRLAPEVTTTQTYEATMVVNTQDIKVKSTMTSKQTVVEHAH